MPARVRFGLFEFDPVSGALVREGTPIRLQPQPARVLTLLLERPGELITRDELRAHVWGNETYVDFERGLNFCIAQIRSALGDSAESPRYIETIPKRGYRFIAPTGGTGDVGGAGLPPSREASADRRSLGGGGKTGPSRRNLGIALALLVSLAAALGAFVFVRQQVATPATLVPVAVVPFDNQTGSIAFDAVAEGLADATVARLAQSDRLAVVGNAPLLRTARSFRDVKRIGAELTVDYVVLGQVQRDGERVRVVAHLIRVSDERHVWANRFDRPALTLDVQGEIADAIAREVARRLQPSE